jgi:hypothetical protein
MIQFRDLLLLFVGAALLFFAILITDLIPTDAQADNRLNPPVEYQYAVLHMYLDNLQSYSRIYHNQYQVFPYTQISNLTSSKFAGKGLNRVMHKFRNGGAHDSRINEEDCQDCVKRLIGSKEEPGYLQKLANI